MTTAEIWTRSGPYQVTWLDFGLLCAELARQVRADGFVADAVCAVARGGLLAAGYLMSTLDVDGFHVVRVRRTVDDDVYAMKQPAALEVVTEGGLRGARRVLIVDDIVGSGATAELVREHVAADGRDIRVAALAYNPRSTYRPHYRAVDVDDWVVFPWEPALTTGGRPVPVGPAIG